MPLQGLKTLLFNIGMLAVASPDVLALIPPKTALYIAVFGNLALRAATSTPMIGMGGITGTPPTPTPQAPDSTGNTPNFPSTR